jgi:hypothetical protein
VRLYHRATGSPFGGGSADTVAEKDKDHAWVRVAIKIAIEYRLYSVISMFSMPCLEENP